MLTEFRNHLTARRRSPNTIRLRMVYLRLLNDTIPLTQATPTHLEQILAAHREWKPETVNAAISSWRVFYKWAIRHGHTESDPTIDLELAYVPRVVKVLADDERVKAALAGASIRDQALLLLGRECALRRSEIASLHADNLQGDRLHIIGKGGRARTVVPSPRLLEILVELNTGGYFFPGGCDGHLAPSTVYEIVTRLIGTPTHSLRRRALTVVYNRSGHNLRLTQEFAGHADPNTTAIYLDVSDEDRAQAAALASLAA